MVGEVQVLICTIVTDVLSTGNIVQIVSTITFAEVREGFIWPKERIPMKETGADRVENAVHMMTSIIVIIAQKEGFTVKTASTITNVNNLKIDFN